MPFNTTKLVETDDNSLTVVSDGHHVNEKKSRLVIGGYGEAVMTRTFYTDSWQRYTHADLYKDDKGYGRFDLPHVVIFLGYDFGRGWSMGTEIEFEHGGTESAIEIEEEETFPQSQDGTRGRSGRSDQFTAQPYRILRNFPSRSPYEFKIANSYATAMRVDNYSVKGLRSGSASLPDQCGKSL